MGVIGGLIAILNLFGILFKAWDYMQCKFALQVALAQTDKNVERTQLELAIYKLESYSRALQQRIWIAEDRLTQKPSDKTATQQKREYTATKADVDKQIDALRKQDVALGGTGEASIGFAR